MDSIDKLFEYVARVSKTPITIDGKVILDRPVQSVSISSTFFLKDNCEMCGRCCLNENNAYTVGEFSKAASAPNSAFTRFGLDPLVREEFVYGIRLRDYVFNSKPLQMIEFPKDKSSAAQRVSFEGRPNLERCHWLFERDGTYRCKIHPMRSITCGMPHLRFFFNKETCTTVLGVSQYGRNWALGCPVEFGGYDEQSVKERLYWLERLYWVAVELEVETYLPEITAYLRSGQHKPVTFVNNERRKLF